MFRSGLEVVVEREMGSQKIRSRTKVIGVKSERYLILEMPLHDGTAAFTVSGGPCIIRFVDQGRVVGFSTEVIQIHYDPSPMLFVAYPEELEEVTLREAPRLHTAIPTAIQAESLGPEPVQGMMVDLSEGGARILTRAKPAKEENLSLAFGLPSGRSYDDVAARVVSTAAGGEDEVQLGVKFLEIPPELAEEIKNLIQLIPQVVS
ncbi:MAG: flagellar brake protein [Proteobacteria bacterium]|nr:flagellar brake protein [Pseudomonadota bacterium]